MATYSDANGDNTLFEMQGWKGVTRQFNSTDKPIVTPA